MRKILFFFLTVSTLLGTTFAYEMASCPSGSGCDQCFRNTLGSATSSSDVFVPRAGQREQIDTAASTITAATFQGVAISPTGNIKSSYTLDDGPSTTSWTWAAMNGSLIVPSFVPSSIDYTSPVYRITYTTHSYTVDSNNQKNVGTDVTNVECAYFYIDEPTYSINGQCSSLATWSTENPTNSSLSGQTLCSRGTASSVSYRSSDQQWVYTCSGMNGGTSDACRVDLLIDSDNDACRIAVTDASGIVPFETSFLCSGDPQGKTAIVISRSGTILDALEGDSLDYTFDDSGMYRVSCYPDIVNDRTNVCRTSVYVSGDCGNYTEESDEQCDDGNTTSGDGCNRTCQLE